MAMELHYFDGDCNTEETKTQIKQLFIKILNGSVRYSQACQDPYVRDKCKAENVVVTCGEVDESVGNRKKRSIGKLFGLLSGWRVPTLFFFLHFNLVRDRIDTRKRGI